MTDFMIFTHTLNEKHCRRFTATPTERELYRKVESEISWIIFHKIANGSYKNMSLEFLYEYVEYRFQSFNKAEFQDLVDEKKFLAHIKDYCDIRFYRAFGKPPCGLPERMKKYSEVLPINIRKGEKYAQESENAFLYP